MPKKTSKKANWHRQRINTTLKWLRQRSLLTKVMLSLAGLMIISLGLMYGIGLWFKLKHQSEPMTWGTSWSFKYSKELGINPYQGFEAVLESLPIKRIRIMSYWDVHEPINDQYVWDELDWQFDTVEAYNRSVDTCLQSQANCQDKIDVSLAVGLRQPRWPECHWPQWAQAMPAEQWHPQLNEYIEAVVARYNDRASLAEYQLENEFFLKAFGICPDHDRQRLINEYELLNGLTDKRITISRSNNALGWPVYQPTPDDYGISIYKRVYDVTVTKHYFEYPFPAWFYGFLAGISEITQGKQGFFIHELQAEPWGPQPTRQLDQEEQMKSMDARRLKARLEYAHNTGIRTIDIWGAEWYYWQFTEFNNPSLWTTVQQQLIELD